MFSLKSREERTKSQAFTKRINSLEKLNIGGVDQWVLIRGKNINNPLLLFLHGGPGTAQIAFAPRFQARLEEEFVVINWDQRGSGKSYSSNIPADSMSLEQLVRDTCELVGKILKRFRREKMYLAGHSWGSVLGILAAKQCPDHFYAFIGIAQVVDMDETSRILCKYNFDAVNKFKDKKAVKELQEVGYSASNKTTRAAMIHIKWLERFGGVFKNLDLKKIIKRHMILSPWYSIHDKLNYTKGCSFSFNKLFDDLMGVNLFKTVPEIKVPAYFCIGCHDYNAPFKLAEQYYNRLIAPKKKLFWFGNSGHAPHFEEPDKFTNLLISTILPETYQLQV